MTKILPITVLNMNCIFLLHLSIPHYFLDQFQVIFNLKKINLISNNSISFKGIFLVDRFNKHIQLIVIQLAFALAFFIYPFCTSAKLLYFVAVIEGFLFKASELIPILFVIEMFRNTKYQNTFLLLMHFFKHSGKSKFSESSFQKKQLYFRFF